MARDVNMKVRAETFSALGKVQSVSENLLLQSLSKKMLQTRGIKDTVGQLAVINSELPLSSFAGAFMHGIEDEFHEVRLAACKSLGLISILSIQFAASALDLLMDMLNDDAIAIRLLTLEILYQMTTNDWFVVQDKHWEMFLSLLNDTSASIRYATRKLLRLLKLPKLQIFKATINSLLTNLERHPEEEEDIFFILFCIGIHHAKFGSKVATEYLSKLKVSNVGELTLDAPSVSGQLVLAVSSSFSEEGKYTDIPSVLFSYAIPLVGRISRSLGGLIREDILSSYLFHLSGIHFPFVVPKQKDNELTAMKLERAIANSIKYRDKLCNSCFSYSCDNPKIELGNDLFAQGGFSTSFELNDNKGHVDDRLRGRIELILEEVQETWSLIQGKSILVAQKMLRTCKKELEVLSLDVSGSGAVLVAFALEYIQVIEVVSGMWWQIHAKNFKVSGIDVMDIMIEKLESSVWGIRYCFLGLAAKEECLLLELLLLGYLLQLKKVGIYVNDVLKRIRVVIYRLQLLAEEGSNLSDFFAEAKKYYVEETANEPLQPSLDNLIQLFNLRPMPLCGRLRHIKADLKALCGSSEIPLHFISGFPIGITFQVFVYNASQLDRTWLRMVVGDSVQYINIDFSQIEGCDDVRKGTLTVPFCATPKASSFLLKAFMLLEFPLGDASHLKRDARGPKHGCAQISNDVDVHFVQANRHR
ncbi:hypothetical protein HPP92_025099 [Vanilla planifolia]|uniref:Protein SIEL n=1 Tax=Vanilla planifolia TaxID=51239 RepID=A0A835PER7_VANPL|nr:hypothetical protein HPP92_025099 [Vanilla planifolia]